MLLAMGESYAAFFTVVMWGLRRNCFYFRGSARRLKLLVFKATLIVGFDNRSATFN